MSAHTISVASRPSQSLREGNRRYLTGVQGLRTVAALLVAVYHIWFDRVSGGVDVFFVIAGYFAAMSMLRLHTEPSTTQRIRAIGTYLLRTARRVLPATAVVVTGTIVAAIFWMREDLSLTNMSHAVASALHVENWWLIHTNADYLQSESPASPFQQFWALSLQVQFYLFFPLVAFVSVTALRRYYANPRHALILISALIFASSFTFAVSLTAINQPAAYFNTFTRLWEFSAGSLLFLIVTKGFKNRHLNVVLGLLGLGILFFFGAFFDLSTLFPGFVALIPVGAAVLIILSAMEGQEPAFLRSPLMLWFADSSFAFYLWHWPILIFWQSRFGTDVSVVGGLIIMGLALTLAVITTQVVEAPIRNSSWIQISATRTVTVCLILAIPVVGSYGAWKFSLNDYQVAQEQARVDLENFSEVGASSSTLIPDPAVAREDLTDAYGKGCQQARENPEVIECWWGPEDAKKTVALVGGSHSTQWLDAVRKAAEASDARIRLMVKSACAFGDLDTFPEGIYPPDCTPWAEDVLERVLEGPTDLVVTIATGKQQPEDIPQGFRNYFEVLSQHEIPVVAIRDNPRFPTEIPACVVEQGIEACTYDRSKFFIEVPDLQVPDYPGFMFVDIADDLCTETVCPPVRENVLIYMDRQHITRTFTMTHGERVISAVENALN